jgi:hypothetical protein
VLDVAAIRAALRTIYGAAHILREMESVNQ